MEIKLETHNFLTKMASVVFLLVILAGLSNAISKKCLLRDYGNDKRVCVCNKYHCDTIDPVKAIKKGNYWKYTSNIEGKRFEKTVGQFSKRVKITNNQIRVSSDDVRQKIHGFGGAFTDAAGINIMALNENVRNKLMRSYFSHEGIEYSIGRTALAATDFSTHPYTYHDEEDVTLSSFSLAEEDYLYKIPLMAMATDLTKNTIKFLSTTWVAPKWMKSNGSYLPGPLKENLYQVFVNYYIKFLDAYKKENLTFWGLSIANEPVIAYTSDFDVPLLQINSSMTIKLIRDHFIPTLRNSSHSDVKLIVFDDQTFLFSPYVNNIFNDTKVKSYSDGIAIHTYFPNDTNSEVLNGAHRNFSDKFVIATEYSLGIWTSGSLQLGLWDNAEDYATNIMEDMNNWVTGWVDWNIALNPQGGPSYAGNSCEAPIVVNATAQEFLKQPMYYAIGHFSKFVPADSHNIFSSGFDDQIPVTSFIRPDGGVVIVIVNKYNVSVEATIVDKHRGPTLLDLSARSLTTIVYW